MIIENYRIVHHSDIIPMMPPVDLGYHHNDL
jgi:hypothetical protein